MGANQRSFVPWPIVVASLFFSTAPTVRSFSIPPSGVVGAPSIGNGGASGGTGRRRPGGVAPLHAGAHDAPIVGGAVVADDEEKFVPDESAPLLEVQNLRATIEGSGAEILKGLDLTVNKGEVHAIMGLNGSGKSTLSKVLVGHPAYGVTEGSEILYKGASILDLEPDERSHIGMFLAFQYPVELPGVSNEDFLRVAYNSRREYYGEPPLDPLEFMLVCAQKLDQVKLDPKFLSRNVNEGFSGGEKKRNEMFQMVMLDCQLNILDETDSGLDIDAMRTISEGINKFTEGDDSKSVILITHYQRLLDFIKPDFVHVMKAGRIVKTGDASLAKELEEKGYAWIED